MTTQLQALTARRVALQADCAQQRDEMQQLYRGIEGSAVRVDRAVDTVRNLAPAIIAGGFAVLFAFGPGRALRILRRTFTVAVYANEALRLLR